MRSKRLLIELLELILEGEGRLSLSEVSKRLKSSSEEVFKAFSEALNNKFIYRNGDRYRLTVIGEELLTMHREEELHKIVHKHIHGNNVDRVKKWNSHWIDKHGLSRFGLDYLRASLKSMPVRIEDIIPLPAIPEGGRGVVVFLYGGRGLVRKLADMGLTPGVEITVLRRGFLGGPIQISVRGTRLALGYGVARRVFVRRV